MRKTLLTTAVLLGAGLAAPAFAQGNAEIRPGHTPGVGLSEPSSSMASNIDKGDARSTIAPRLPDPHAGDQASPDQYLRDAEQALGKNKTGEAQEALERAQTRMLDRSVEQGQTGTPDQDPRIQTVEQARQALGKRDTKGATRLIGQALAMNGTGGQPAPQQGRMSSQPGSPMMNGMGMPPGTMHQAHPPAAAPGPQLGTHSYAPGGTGDAGSSGSVQ